MYVYSLSTCVYTHVYHPYQLSFTNQISFPNARNKLFCGQIIIPKQWFKNPGVQLDGLWHWPGVNVNESCVTGFSKKKTWLLFFFFGHALGMQKFPGQGSNPHHSSDPNYSNDNAGSSTAKPAGNSQNTWFLLKRSLGAGGVF